MIGEVELVEVLGHAMDLLLRGCEKRQHSPHCAVHSQVYARGYHHWTDMLD